MSLLKKFFAQQNEFCRDCGREIQHGETIFTDENIVVCQDCHNDEPEVYEKYYSK